MSTDQQWVTEEKKGEIFSGNMPVLLTDQPKGKNCISINGGRGVRGYQTFPRRQTPLLKVPPHFSKWYLPSMTPPLSSHLFL